MGRFLSLCQSVRVMSRHTALALVPRIVPMLSQWRHLPQRARTHWLIPVFTPMIMNAMNPHIAPLVPYRIALTLGLVVVIQLVRRARTASPRKSTQMVAFMRMTVNATSLPTVLLAQIHQIAVAPRAGATLGAPVQPQAVPVVAFGRMTVNATSLPTVLLAQMALTACRGLAV